MNRLLYDQNKHKCKTYFCDRCLYGFTKRNYLSNTKRLSWNQQNLTRIEMPMKDRSHITLKKHQNLMPISYAIYADFESIIKPKTAKAGDKSEIKSEHEACEFGY